MRSKDMVAISLVAFLFIILNILLFGLMDLEVFPFAYLVFAGTFMGLTVFLLKDYFETRTQLMTALVLALLVAGSMTFLMSLLKGNDIAFRSIESKKASLSNEIAELTANNEYYSDYASYISRQIDSYRNSTEDLESQIESAKKDIEATLILPEPSYIEPPQEVTYIYEDEYEEEDEYDHEEEEDEEDDHEEEEEDDDD